MVATVPVPLDSKPTTAQSSSTHHALTTSVNSIISCYDHVLGYGSNRCVSAPSAISTRH